jgi:probable rRNA maturation factor
MAKIEITDLQDHVRLDKKTILQILRRVMKEEGRSAKSLSIVLTDNRHIRDLNREYLGHDTATDVISFPLEDLDTPARASRSSSAETAWPDGGSAQAAGCINGEIIASAELALHQAMASRGDPQAELLLYLVHGLLHLMGYDDIKPQDAKRMHEREDELLEKFGFVGVCAARSAVQ